MTTATNDMIERFKQSFERGAALQALKISKINELEIGEIAYFAAAPYEAHSAALARIRQLAKDSAKLHGIKIVVKDNGKSIRIRRMPPHSTGMYSEWLNLNVGQIDTVFEGHDLEAQLKKARNICTKLNQRGEGYFEVSENVGEIQVQRLSKSRDGVLHGLDTRWKDLDLPSANVAHLGGLATSEPHPQVVTSALEDAPSPTNQSAL